MKALYVTGILVLVTIGIFMTLRFGYEPAPIKVMKPTKFSKPEEVGAVTYRRFYAPIEQKKLVAFGIPLKPEWHREVIRGFLAAAAAENKAFDAILMEEQMPALDLTGLPSIEVVALPTNTPAQAELIDQIKKWKTEGKRVLVYLPSVFSTRILDGNVVNRYEKTTGERLLTITSAPLALRPNQEHVVDPPCRGSERDASGTVALGCTIVKSGRGFYRKKIEQDQWVAMMNSPKPEDYLLMISTPGQDQATGVARQ